MLDDAAAAIAAFHADISADALFRLIRHAMLPFAYHATPPSPRHSHAIFDAAMLMPPLPLLPLPCQMLMVMICCATPLLIAAGLMLLSMLLLMFTLMLRRQRRRHFSLISLLPFSLRRLFFFAATLRFHYFSIRLFTLPLLPLPPAAIIAYAMPPCRLLPIHFTRAATYAIIDIYAAMPLRHFRYLMPLLLRC